MNSRENASSMLFCHYHHWYHHNHPYCHYQSLFFFFFLTAALLAGHGTDSVGQWITYKLFKRGVIELATPIPFHTVIANSLLPAGTIIVVFIIFNITCIMIIATMAITAVIMWVLEDNHHGIQLWLCKCHLFISTLLL